MEAVADGLICFPIRFDRHILRVGLFHVDLPTATSDGAALVIDESGCQYPPKPSTDRADIPQLPGAFKRPERKKLQKFFGFVPAAHPVTQKREKFLSRLDKRASHSGIRGL